MAWRCFQMIDVVYSLRLCWRHQNLRLSRFYNYGNKVWETQNMVESWNLTTAKTAKYIHEHQILCKYYSNVIRLYET